MIHIMHYMSILKLSDEIIKTYGRYPDERDPGLQSARKIYKAAFGELVRQGMPYTKKAGLLKIETDGEVYAANKYLMEGVHTDQTREGKEHAAPVPAFSYAPYVMAQADDDEDLDVTKVMSFTEAMDRERAGEKEGQESTDEEYVQTAPAATQTEEVVTSSTSSGTYTKTETVRNVVVDDTSTADTVASSIDTGYAPMPSNAGGYAPATGGQYEAASYEEEYTSY